MVYNKVRTIGKIVAIKTNEFDVELLNDINNFNVNSFDDIYSFTQLNSYVLVPYQSYYIVCEIIGVYEKDNINKSYTDKTNNKINSTKILKIVPIGTIDDNMFKFGITIFPTLYSDVLHITNSELDKIFTTNDPINSHTNRLNLDPNNKVHNNILYELPIGKSSLFQGYEVKININKFFGAHSAVLGNTGSGKSCTITSMLQTLYKNHNHVTGSTFIIFDVNGEYKNIFLESNTTTKYLTLNAEDNKNEFILPHNFLTIEEWAILLQASEKTQLPILRNALKIANLMHDDKDKIEQIIAKCIVFILNNVKIKDTLKCSKIISIVSNFPTENINHEKDEIKNNLNINYGKMEKINELRRYINELITWEEEPLLDEQIIGPFNFNDLEQSMEIAIIYEESHGNEIIRNYCSPLITRFKTIKQRSDFKFIKEDIKDKKKYLKEILGLNENSIKENQVIIVDLSFAEDEIVEIISTILTRLIFDCLKEIKERNTYPVNIILEEAHRYISNENRNSFLKATKIFDRVAKEGRKYGLFLLVSSQCPSELSKIVLSQCNNFIVHRIQNPDDLSYIRRMTPHISETTLNKLPSIPTQHALIFGTSVNIPCIFKVNNANPTPRSNDNDISKNWFIEKDKIFNIL